MNRIDMQKEPVISVGIMSAPSVEFALSGRFRCGDHEPEGRQCVSYSNGDGLIEWNGVKFRELMFTPVAPGCTFELADVAIGVNFHWERRERQRFAGALKLVADRDACRCVAINVVGVEEYLKSVISSEMCADASDGLLRAHAVASRSWLLCQLAGRGRHLPQSLQCRKPEVDGIETDEIVRWYDREDHTLFDVCADDHCQRYQGLTRQTSPSVARAVDETRGLVLTFDGEVCDARFSKCCGGVTETFATCWEETPAHPYLESVPDCDDHGDCFCDTADSAILKRILNGYDREEPDFSRWEVTYTGRELAELVRSRSGFDFGEIEELRPLQRGASGRITRLLVRGTLRSMVVGKELEIRRWLSPSHLKSSAFDVEHDAETNRFILHGRGWGHGVGMCQIGAAVMGERGYGWRAILEHYFPKATLEKLYM